MSEENLIAPDVTVLTMPEGAPPLPSASGGTVASAGAKMRRREDEDDPSSETTFETVVKLSDGRSFNVDLFNDAEYDAWNGWMKEFGEGLKTSVDPDALFTKHAHTIDDIISSKVKGRDGYATTPEKRLKMFFPDKVELVEGVAGKSKVGHTASDFLA